MEIDHLELFCALFLLDLDLVVLATLKRPFVTILSVLKGGWPGKYKHTPHGLELRTPYVPNPRFEANTPSVGPPMFLILPLLIKINDEGDGGPERGLREGTVLKPIHRA